MGTDIKLVVECRDVAVAGEWRVAERPSDWSNDDLEIVTRQLTEFDARYGGWFSDRNYELFAWLAGVRDRHNQGMLGEELRDIPHDSPADTFKRLHGYDSLTWYTVAELQAGLGWVTVKHAGLVPQKAYDEWKHSGSPSPEEWCQGSSTPCISEARYLAGDRPDCSGPLAWAGFNVRCEWSLPGTVAFARFGKLLAHLSTLAAPGDVRIVMGFS